MIAKAKAYAIAAIAFLLAALAGAATYFRKRAQLETERRQASEGARRIERTATDAAIAGEKKINEAANAKVDSVNRDHFERP